MDRVGSCLWEILPSGHTVVKLELPSKIIPIPLSICMEKKKNKDRAAGMETKLSLLLTEKTSRMVSTSRSEDRSLGHKPRQEEGRPAP